MDDRAGSFEHFDPRRQFQLPLEKLVDVTKPRSSKRDTVEGHEKRAAATGTR